MMNYRWCNNNMPCPKTTNTWCKYWQDKLHNKGMYTEDSRLPSVSKSELKYLFERLSNDELLKRCIHSLTQNQNESINNVLWSLCSKRTFCDLKKLSFCVTETVMEFLFSHILYPFVSCFQNVLDDLPIINGCHFMNFI